jgi:V/A-type H+-transporting ATPase subunit I
MVRLFAVVLEHDADSVAEVLLDHGVVHFMDVSQLNETWSHKLKPLENTEFIPAISDLRRRVESLIGASGENPYSSDQADTLHATLKDHDYPNLEEIRDFVENLSSKLTVLRQKQRSVAGEIVNLTEVRDQVGTYGIGLSRTGEDENFSFIAMRVGSLQAEKEKELRQAFSQIPSVVIVMAENDEHVQLLLVQLKRDKQKTEPVLHRLGWKDLDLSPDVGDFRSNVISDIEKKITQLRMEEKEREREIADILKKDLDVLKHMWHRLFVYEKYCSIQSYFRKTSRTVMFSGWLPSENRPKLIDALEQTTGGHCYLEWGKSAESLAGGTSVSKPPVQFRNPGFLSPFQMLVTGYTIPSYGTIDPTFFVIFAYLLMFGLMFADVGQGLVLLCTGVFASILFKRQGRKENLQNLMKLIAWCGLSSVVFGALFGSYFGFRLIQPLWFDYHRVVLGDVQGQTFVRDLFDILSIAVYFGIAVIAVGLLFNWINLIRLRQWAALILDKGGIVGAWIYGGGIYTALYLVKNGYRQLPDTRILLLLVGIPAFLLFIKQPLYEAFNKKRFSGKPQHTHKSFRFNTFTPLNMIMVGIVELLEVFSGYLSNTLSFLRVAGLGIAHVSLMAAFAELARMAGSRGTGVFSPWSVLILVMGNLLVIGLEGLSAGIQSLRLHYYEFFTKFLRGSGDVYAPVSLRRVKEE